MECTKVIQQLKIYTVLNKQGICGKNTKMNKCLIAEEK